MKATSNPDGIVFNLVGEQFGSLTVIDFSGKDSKGNKLWKCECSCGEFTNIRQTRLIRGKVKNCKCRGLSRDEVVIRQILCTYKKQASQNLRSFSLTDDQFRKIIKSDCYYCGSEPQNIRRLKRKNRTFEYIYNGIDRINNEIGYQFENCVACCYICNRAKNSLPVNSFTNWINRLVKHAQSQIFKNCS